MAMSPKTPVLIPSDNYVTDLTLKILKDSTNEISGNSDIKQILMCSFLFMLLPLHPLHVQLADVYTMKAFNGYDLQFTEAFRLLGYKKYNFIRASFYTQELCSQLKEELFFQPRSEQGHLNAILKKINHYLTANKDNRPVSMMSVMDPESTKNMLNKANSPVSSMSVIDPESTKNMLNKANRPVSIISVINPEGVENMLKGPFRNPEISPGYYNTNGPRNTRQRLYTTGVFIIEDMLAHGAFIEKPAPLYNPPDDPRGNPFVGQYLLDVHIQRKWPMSHYKLLATRYWTPGIPGHYIQIFQRNWAYVNNFPLTIYFS